MYDSKYLSVGAVGAFPLKRIVCPYSKLGGPTACSDYFHVLKGHSHRSDNGRQGTIRVGGGRAAAAQWTRQRYSTGCLVKQVKRIQGVKTWGPCRDARIVHDGRRRVSTLCPCQHSSSCNTLRHYYRTFSLPVPQYMSDKSITQKEYK